MGQEEKVYTTDCMMWKKTGMVSMTLLLLLA